MRFNKGLDLIEASQNVVRPRFVATSRQICLELCLVCFPPFQLCAVTTIRDSLCLFLTDIQLSHGEQASAIRGKITPKGSLIIFFFNLFEKEKEKYLCTQGEDFKCFIWSTKRLTKFHEKLNICYCFIRASNKSNANNNK